MGSNNIKLSDCQNKELLKKRYKKIDEFMKEFNKRKPSNNPELTFSFKFGKQEVSDDLLPTPSMLNKV